MCETENNKTKQQFRQLLELFDEILEQSEDYHIVHFPKLGYIALNGKYMPGCDSNIVLDNLMFLKYFPTPDKMADSLMENLRWQWYMQNGKPVCTDQYESIVEMDDELSEERYPEYFEIIRKYKSGINDIMGLV